MKWKKTVSAVCEMSRYFPMFEWRSVSEREDDEWQDELWFDEEEEEEKKDLRGIDGK